jgi:hypothetical protein
MDNAEIKTRHRILSPLKSKWKTLLVIAVMATVSFTAGTFANTVVVQNSPQSLGGNEVRVPAPEFQVVDSSWQIDLNSSTVTAVALVVTTVGGPNVTKLYQVDVEVSCLASTTPPTKYICSGGNGVIPLPANMHGAATTLLVTLTTPVDPEATEVHDLSFIVTGTLMFTPAVTAVPSSPTVSLSPTTGNVSLNIPIVSVNGFGGSVTLIAAAPPGLSVALSTGSVSLAPGGMSMVTGTVAITGLIDPGTYYITIGATPTSPTGAALMTETYYVATPMLFCIGHFTITSNPTTYFTTSSAIITNAFVKTIHDYCYFAGPVNLSINNPTPGAPIVSFQPYPPVTTTTTDVLSSSTIIATLGETVDTTHATAGTYYVTTCATGTSLFGFQVSSCVTQTIIYVIVN